MVKILTRLRVVTPIFKFLWWTWYKLEFQSGVSEFESLDAAYRQYLPEHEKTILERSATHMYFEFTAHPNTQIIMEIVDNAEKADAT